MYILTGQISVNLKQIFDRKNISSDLEDNNVSINHYLSRQAACLDRNLLRLNTQGSSSCPIVHASLVYSLNHGLRLCMSMSMFHYTQINLCVSSFLQELGTTTTAQDLLCFYSFKKHTVRILFVVCV